MSQKITQTLILSLGLTLSTSVYAQETAPAEGEAAAPVSQVDAASLRAHEIALDRLSQELSHEMMAGLQMAAWATAAAGLCVDLELDEGSLYADIVKSAHEDLPDATPEEAQRHRDIALIAFGVLTGMRLEDAAADEAAFCAEAVQIAGEAGEDFYIRTVSTAVPLPAGN